MNSSTSSAPKARADFVPAPLRKDLVIVEQSYLGRRFLILKNPIGLNYFRLPVAHGRAVEFFNGKNTFRVILDELRKSDGYWRAMRPADALEELSALAKQLAMGGLLRVQGGSAVARARHLKEGKARKRFEIAIGKILYFRKSLIDPDRLLEGMMPYLGWMFSRTFCIGLLIFFAVTLVAALRQWDAITTQAANFFTFENLALTWVSFFGVKIFHEFGHGLTCKRMGGEVHEMGFMFILFTPYLYCNVSDSWRANKSSRIAVTSAGIIMELTLACVATWFWLVTQPGLFHQMCFNTMFLCSVSTVLFNANPLMKFDGYYIMTDLLEIPNLKQKSNACVTQWAQRVFFGIQSQAKMATFEYSPLFGIYAILSYLYGWFVLFRISLMLFDILKPYDLEVLSRSYVLMFLFVSVALPFYRLFLSVKRNPALRSAALPRARFVLVGIVCGFGLLFVIPWEDSIKRMIVIEHAHSEPITPRSEGFLRDLPITEGQSLKKGQYLGRLENEDLLLEKVDLELQIELSKIKYRATISSDRADLHQVAATHQKMIHELEEKLKGIEEKIQAMIIYSPSDGVVRTWDIDKQIGQYFTPQHAICEIGDNKSLRAVVPLNEREARSVAVGQKVVFRLFADPEKVFRGVVAVRPVSALDRFSSPGMANLFGGDVPSEPDSDPNRIIKPSLPHYEAEVVIDDFDPMLRPGMMGKCRIDVGRTTIGKWLLKRLSDHIDPDVRL